MGWGSAVEHSSKGFWARVSFIVLEVATGK